MTYMERKAQNLNLPKVFEDIWNGNPPDSIGCNFASPKSMTEALQEHPDGFCKSSQLMPLWETNGHALTGYLTEDKLFIEWAYENGPDEYKVISSKYEGLLGHIFRSFIYSRNPEQLKELATIFSLDNLEALI